MTQTKVIDRVIPGVGRIKRASGTTKLSTFRAINDAIDTLREMGRLDILRALKSKRRPTPLEVLDAVRSKNIGRLTSAEMMVTLHGALDTFAKDYPCGEKYRADIRSSVKRLKRLTSKHDTVSALPDAVRAAKEELSKKHRAFNALKSHTQAFAKWHAGERSELYQDITAVTPYPKKRQRTPHPIDVAELLEIVPRLNNLGKMTRNNHPIIVALGDMAWTMCVTGMRPIEYWSRDWEDKGDFVQVATAKRKDGERAVRKLPRVRPLVAPGCGRDVFAEKLATASEGRVQPYDLRRTFSNWIEKAGISRTRRRLYMGHGEKDVTDLYEWHEVERDLKEDGARFRAWLAAEIAKAQPDENVIPFKRTEGE